MEDQLMGFLKQRFHSRRALIHIFAISMFICGLIFGAIYYFYGLPSIIDMGNTVFFYNLEGHTNDYNLYIIMTSVYIIASLLVSTSFIGCFLNSFIIFTKSMQISIGTIYLFAHVHIQAAEIFTCYVPQLLIEIVLMYIISIITLKLSLNSFMVAFVIRDNFNSKKIINYILDYIMIILILLTASMLFRVYAL